MSPARRVYLALAAAGVGGTAVELATDRHWNSAVQLIPWVALGTLAAAIAVTATSTSATATRFAIGLAVVVAITGIGGVVEHVWQNYEAAPLDFRYATRWATMSTISRWWAAANGSVGPSPILAPLILTQSAALTWLAARTEGSAQRR